VIPADCADIASRPGVVADAWSRIDPALIAHGTLPDQAAAEREPAQAAHALLLNFTSPVLLRTALAERFEAQGSGVIVAISSVAGAIVAAIAARRAVRYAPWFWRWVAPLAFPALSVLQKPRYGALMFLSTRRNDWRALEPVSARDWTVRWCGQGVYDRMCKPLFGLKLYQYADNISAYRIWTRIRRIGRSRRSLMQPATCR
jgi:hypothetical protein